MKLYFSIFLITRIGYNYLFWSENHKITRFNSQAFSSFSNWYHVIIKLELIIKLLLLLFIIDVLLTFYLFSVIGYSIKGSKNFTFLFGIAARMNRTIDYNKDTDELVNIITDKLALSYNWAWILYFFNSNHYYYLSVFLATLQFFFLIFFCYNLVSHRINF